MLGGIERWGTGEHSRKRRGKDAKGGDMGGGAKDPGGNCPATGKP